MAIECVFFDVAGTLLVKPGVTDVIYELVAPFVTLDKREVARRHKLLTEASEFPDHTDRDFYLAFNAQLLRALGLPATDALVTALYERCRVVGWEAAPGAKALASLDVRMGIVSNWGGDLRPELADLGLRLDVLVASGEANVRKPDPAIFRLALEQANVEASRSVFVGDSIRLDVEPAQSVGMTTVLVDALDLYPDHPAARVRTLAEIPDLVRSL